MGQEWDRASAVTRAAPLAPHPVGAAALCISTSPVAALLLLPSQVIRNCRVLGGDILILGEEKQQ